MTSIGTGRIPRRSRPLVSVATVATRWRQQSPGALALASITYDIHIGVLPMVPMSK